MSSVAARKATQTAIGPVNGVGVRTVSSRGSSAGLKKAKSAWLQHNESGYMNKANQTARNRPRPNMARGGLNYTPGVVSGSSARIRDTRLTKFGDSSISKLNKRL